MNPIRKIIKNLEQENAAIKGQNYISENGQNRITRNERLIVELYKAERNYREEFIYEIIQNINDHPKIDSINDIIDLLNYMKPL